MGDNVAYVPAGVSVAGFSPSKFSLSSPLCGSVCQCVFRRQRVGNWGSAAETDIIPFREEVFPSRYLHPLCVSVCACVCVSLSPSLPASHYVQYYTPPISPSLSPLFYLFFFVVVLLLLFFKATIGE